MKKILHSFNFFYFVFAVMLVFTSCVSASKFNAIQTQQINFRNPQAAVQNLGVVTRDDAAVFKKVYALSDVHGMFNEAVSLLKAGDVIDENSKWIAGPALLMIVGDSIDKGPQSIEVIDLWIRLQAEARLAGGDLIHVLGNHEAEFLSDPENKKAQELLDELAAKKISTAELTSLSSVRGQFLHGEPVAAKIGKWLFCHSGFYPEMSWESFSEMAQKTIQAQDYKNLFLIGDDSILEAKDWEKHHSSLSSVLARLDTIGVFGVVFGHQPDAFGIEGRSAAKEGGRLIKIDNGLPPEAGSHAGSLLVFTNPSQMNESKYPDIKVIFPNQQSVDLRPE